MSVIKKINVNAHFAAKRAMRLGKKRTLGYSGATGIQHAPSAKDAPATGEDKPAGNSAPATSVNSIPNEEDSDNTRVSPVPRNRPM